MGQISRPAGVHRQPLAGRNSFCSCHRPFNCRAGAGKPPHGNCRVYLRHPWIYSLIQPLGKSELLFSSLFLIASRFSHFLFPRFNLLQHFSHPLIAKRNALKPRLELRNEQIFPQIFLSTISLFPSAMIIAIYSAVAVRELSRDRASALSARKWVHPRFRISHTSLFVTT